MELTGNLALVLSVANIELKICKDFDRIFTLNRILDIRIINLIMDLNADLILSVDDHVQTKLYRYFCNI